jgi:hypothetical protein
MKNMPVDAWLPTRRLMAEKDRCVAARMACWGPNHESTERANAECEGIPSVGRQCVALLPLLIGG